MTFRNSNDVICKLWLAQQRLALRTKLSCYRLRSSLPLNLENGAVYGQDQRANLNTFQKGATSSPAGKGVLLFRVWRHDEKGHKRWISYLEPAIRSILWFCPSLLRMRKCLACNGSRKWNTLHLIPALSSRAGIISILIAIFVQTFLLIHCSKQTSSSENNG